MKKKSMAVSSPGNRNDLPHVYHSTCGSLQPPVFQTSAGISAYGMQDGNCSNYVYG